MFNTFIYFSKYVQSVFKIEESCWQLFFWLILLLNFSIYGRSKFGHVMSNTCFEIFAIKSFALLESSCNNLYVYFTLFTRTIITDMPSFIRNKTITCENCGTQTTKFSLARHTKRCSAGEFYCTQCDNFSTKSQNDLNYHIAQEHCAPKPAVTFE